MTYPDNFEIKIAFNAIRSLLKNKCLGEKAKEYVDSLSFFNSKELIETLLIETEEMKNICMLKDNFPANYYPSIDDFCNKLKIENTVFQLFEFFNLKLVLENAKSLLHFFNSDDSNSYPFLSKKIKKVSFPKYIYDRLDQVISKDGNIKDNASTELKRIRIDLASRQNSVSKKLLSILSHVKEEGWVSKDLSATLVNGRLVIPIETTYKRKIQGLVHDESASGKTTYIEPQEIVAINNDIRELEIAENREIHKILLELSNDIRPYLNEILSIKDIVAEIDFIRAKALLAIDIDGIRPQIVDEPSIDIVRAKHPILFLTLKKEKKEVVPISIQLNKDNRIIVISGPNAGGKSVALKTVAILVYMLQCGLLVPVAGASVFGIFNDIFIDIGDQQSIENDLSTYSSHLQNMKFFLKHSNANTLFLIDEFGSGTDPIIGGILAEAILSELNNKMSFGIITTHYSNLKIFASETPGLVNASMLVDNSLKPSFVLEFGVPGSSYTLEIAKRIGLPETIIENTKNKCDNTQFSFDKILKKALKDKRYWENKRLKIRNQENKLQEIYQKHFDELEKLKLNKKAIIEEAVSQAKKIIDDSNKIIENTIKDIKEAAADKNKTKEIRQNLEDFKKDFIDKANNLVNDIELSNENIKTKINKNSQSKNHHTDQNNKNKHLLDNKINIGSRVILKGKDTVGEVVDMSDKKAVVLFGNIYTTIEFSQLEKVNADVTKNKITKASYSNYDKKLLNFNPNLDVRGLTSEEAINRVILFLDEAVMLKFTELRILHGKGNGVLRTNIRNFLNSLANVEKCYSESVEFGGDGITIVKLK